MMSSPRSAKPLRLAMVVSHPIQYFAPLYQRLAQRKDIALKVFFTWHAGEKPVTDSGFGIPVAWDIPVTQGYDYELVANTARQPGTQHFFGLRNPDLVRLVMAWRPDVVHVTGWAWQSHLLALYKLHRLGIPTLFRGDSHLLDGNTRGLRWWLKRTALTQIFSWPRSFLVVGTANRAYYEAFGVGADRLIDCPHAIDVERFAEPDATFAAEAAEWRRDLGIAEDCFVLVYAGKFEPKKQPLQLMQAVATSEDRDILLVMVGGGVLEQQVGEFAARHPKRFVILPFQNQSRMPVVYRLGELFALTSAHGETWGLAVNEAMASGRGVLVSDRVGCARDLVDTSCGRIVAWNDPRALRYAIAELAENRQAVRAMGQAAARRAKAFDLGRTEETVVQAARELAA
jgi:glycosyltransferase involved in cell wall biosynthesis